MCPLQQVKASNGQHCFPLTFLSGLLQEGSICSEKSLLLSVAHVSSAPAERHRDASLSWFQNQSGYQFRLTITHYHRPQDPQHLDSICIHLAKFSFKRNLSLTIEDYSLCFLLFHYEGQTFFFGSHRSCHILRHFLWCSRFIRNTT